MEAKPMMAKEIIEADSNPPSLDGFENYRETHEQYRQDALVKGVSMSGSRTIPLFPIEGQAPIVRQQRSREVYRRSEVEASASNPLSNKRKKDDPPDLSESPWVDNVERSIVRDKSSAVKKFKTSCTSESSYMERIRIRAHVNNRNPQMQQSHKFTGVGRTLGGTPSPQRISVFNFGVSPVAEPFPSLEKTAMPSHGKGNKTGNGMALTESEGMSWEQLKGGLTVEENNTRGFVPGVGPLPVELGPDEVSDKEEEFLVPKLEPGLEDEDLLGSLLGLGGTEKESEDGFIIPTVAKRSRGRPRKHPLHVSGEATHSLGKGRSKTGCITCRKRKKKCDEAKPGCLNCQKNAVLCEGYQPFTTWRSGKEKAASEGGLSHNFLPSSGFPASPEPLPAAGHHASSRIQALGTILPPIIQGVDTPGDKLFFAHYIHRLSDKLTVQGKGVNAFRDEMIPMAVHHVGLMHSILSLSAASIQWDTPYGQNLLRRVPGVTVRDLEDQGHYHQDAALEESRHDISLELAARQKGAQPDPLIMKVRFGQLVCFVVKAMAEGNTEGAHRLHLKAYETYCLDTRDAPAKESSFMDFIREFFQYHIISDQLLVGPANAYPAVSEDEFWISPETQMAPPSPPRYDDPHGPLFCLQHDIYMSLTHRIGSLRNEIRMRMERNEDPHVNYQALHKAAQIDTEIRNWKDPPEPPQSHAEESTPNKKIREWAEKVYSTGVLYKQMLWVYLFRTIYTASPTVRPKFLQLPASNGQQGTQKGNDNPFATDPRIKQVVDHGIQLLEAFDKNDPCQTVLLSPAFIIGCSSFEEHQRDAIRKVLKKIRNYTSLRNADPALRVLEEVWRRMDGRGETGQQGGMEFEFRNRKGVKDGGRESSWDWEKIAREMEVDFLAA